MYTIVPSEKRILQIVTGPGETALFKSGDRVRISDRLPVGHYRVPRYIRGKQAIIESVIEPAAIDNEEEAFGRNAGIKLHYYRVIVPLSQLWQAYPASPNDGLHIEVCENWLKLL